MADEARVERVLAAAVREGAIGEDAPAAMFYDMDAFRAGLGALEAAFPAGTLHALAVKANPLAAMLAEARALGFGAECASEAELEHARRLGFPADRILFDSPAKTRREIATALDGGVTLNADNLDELGRIAARLEVAPSRSLIGLRVNPEVGAGRITSSSTAFRGSKFGVPLGEQREAVLAAFAAHPWLRGLHVHVGSQGCDVALMVAGARRAVELAAEIEARRGRPIDLLDIGGGLPIDYTCNGKAPSFSDYAAALRAGAPGIFEGPFRIATELGRSVSAGAGFFASRVEYVKRAGDHRIAVIHAGADLFLRAAYLPETWSHRISAHDPRGAPKQGPAAPWDVAGPLCFSGDLVARARPLPAVEPGDLVVVHDAGAYTLAMWSRYNSRRAPAVLGYEGDPPRLRLLKAAESLDDVLRFWG
ncbi:MAG: diaminopimelate decarboxylase [Polyangiaceae bacterium]|nr:diaminopimelate decarboxylase [Polyangiaceae bacterium]